MLLLSPNNMAFFEIQLNFGVRNAKFYNGCDGLQATVYSKNNDMINNSENEELYQTETIYHQTNFDFAEKLSVKFQFEKLQRFLVKFSALNSTVNQAMGIYGQSEFDLSLVIANGGRLLVPISNTIHQNLSNLEINIIVPEYYSQYLRLQFYGNNIYPLDGLTQSFYFTLSITKNHRTILLHKSELVKETKNPLWAEFCIPLFILNFYNDSSIHFFCYNHVGNHPDQAIGYCSTTLTQLQRGTGAFNSYMLLDNTGKRIDPKTSVELTRLQLETGPTFFEILKNKTNIHLTEAIDFTASNGNPVLENSLHHIHPHKKSEYVKTILDVTPPFMGYLSSSSIGALGFGAMVSSSNGAGQEISHCFFINGSTVDHHVNGLHQLLESYRKTIFSVQPYAPTDFSEVIYYVSKFAKAETRRRLGIYFVLVIMSDGGPANSTKMKNTVDALVDASSHPMSVLAVGIGENRDFTPMRSLESLTLKHSDGRLLARQNYTFVEANELTSSNALSMIPFQMIQWHKNYN